MTMSHLERQQRQKKRRRQMRGDRHQEERDAQPGQRRTREQQVDEAAQPVGGRDAATVTHHDAQPALEDRVGEVEISVTFEIDADGTGPAEHPVGLLDIAHRRNDVMPGPE